MDCAVLHSDVFREIFAHLKQTWANFKRLFQLKEFPARGRLCAHEFADRGCAFIRATTERGSVHLSARLSSYSYRYPCCNPSPNSVSSICDVGFRNKNCKRHSLLDCVLCFRFLSLSHSLPISLSYVQKMKRECACIRPRLYFFLPKLSFKISRRNSKMDVSYAPLGNNNNKRLMC